MVRFSPDAESLAINPEVRSMDLKKSSLADPLSGPRPPWEKGDARCLNLSVLDEDDGSIMGLGSTCAGSSIASDEDGDSL